VWQHVVLLFCRSKVEYFFYNAILQPRYDYDDDDDEEEEDDDNDDSEFCSLSNPLLKVPFPSELYCLHLFLDNLFHSYIILSVKIVVFWVITVHSMICGWLALLSGLSFGGSRLCKMLVTTILMVP
jgi:hypothetical protein